MNEQDRRTRPDTQEPTPFPVPRAAASEVRERLAAGVTALRRLHAKPTDDRVASESAGETSVVCPDVPKGCTPEEFVVELLEANGGRLSWQPLRAELGWSDKAARGILHGMAADGQIVVLSAPDNRKVAYLPECAPPDGDSV